ncbi:unnamed protein product [Aspergillus oryzae]|nr:unnamed protein product [Aspergillus oryzae]
MSTAMQTEEATREVTLHCRLVIPDICFVDDQVHDVFSCGPLGGLLGDISAETSWVIVQAGAVLGDQAWDLETWEEGAEVHCEAFVGERNCMLIGSCGLGIRGKAYFLKGPDLTQPPPFEGWRKIPGAASVALWGTNAPSPDMLYSEPSKMGELTGSSAYLFQAQ